jgi:hypothetical protein
MDTGPQMEFSAFKQVVEYRPTGFGKRATEGIPRAAFLLNEVAASRKNVTNRIRPPPAGFVGMVSVCLLLMCISLGKQYINISLMLQACRYHVVCFTRASLFCSCAVERLVQDFEDMASARRQLIQKAHHMVGQRHIPRRRHPPNRYLSMNGRGHTLEMGNMGNLGNP